jgi:SAM-dependent methyltransferase
MSIRRVLHLPDESFVYGLYEVLLDRMPDPEGLASHLALLEQGQSRAALVRSFATSEEAQMRRLDTSWLPQLEALSSSAVRGLNGQRLHELTLRDRDGGEEMAVRLEQLQAAVEDHARTLRRLLTLLESQERRKQQHEAALQQLSQGQREVHTLLQCHSNAEDQRWQITQRQVFEDARHQAQVQSVLTAVRNQIAPPAPPAAPPPAQAAPGGCRICGGLLLSRWTGKVFAGRFDAHYHECARCQALQVPQPFWLDEAYREEGAPPAWNPDRGRWVRNFSVYCYLVALHRAGLWQSAPQLLDYGGGYGLLTQMLFDAGYDAWQTDPYVARPFLAGHRFLADLNAVPDQSFDGILAFEVFEHLTDPALIGRLFRRLLRPDGTVVISTGVYEPGNHGPDWPYLNSLEQHVTFWSRAALGHFAAAWGFRSVGYFPDHMGFVIVLSPLADEELRPKLAAAHQLRGEPGFFELATRGWELSRHGASNIRPEALVKPAFAASSGLPPGANPG